jgi:hypothetical protein
MVKRSWLMTDVSVAEHTYRERCHGIACRQMQRESSASSASASAKRLPARRLFDVDVHV